MKITIRNEGNDPTEVVTIFTTSPNGPVATDLLEPATEISYDWDPSLNYRYEVVPWIRGPAPPT